MIDPRLTPIATERRDLYLAHYRAVLRRIQAEHEQVAAELLIELGEQSAALVRRLFRVDVIYGGAASPSVVEANHEPVATDAPLLQLSCPPTVALFPFVWNALEVVWAAPCDLGHEFERWFAKWLDPADERLADTDGFTGVIHSVSVPGPLDGGWGFSVDLGSAPVEALIELLGLPAFQVGGPCRVGSFTYA